MTERVYTEDQIRRGIREQFKNWKPVAFGPETLAVCIMEHVDREWEADNKNEVGVGDEVEWPEGSRPHYEVVGRRQNGTILIEAGGHLVSGIEPKHLLFNGRPVTGWREG